MEESAPSQPPKNKEQVLAYSVIKQKEAVGQDVRNKRTKKAPISKDNIKKVAKISNTVAAQSIAKSIVKRDAGITEIKSVDHLYKETQNLLIETMNKVGLDAESMAKKLKEAVDLSMRTGKTAYGGPDGRTLIEMPDLRALKDLLFLWGNWMRIGRPNATTIGHAQFNLFGNAGLDEASKQRVVGIVELLEAEVKRRGLPDILPGHTEAQDPPALSGMVDAGEGQEETLS